MLEERRVKQGCAEFSPRPSLGLPRTIPTFPAPAWKAHPCGRINYAMTFRSFSALRCSEAPPKVAGAAGLELLSWWCSGKAVGGLGCECLRCWGRTDVWAPGARAESGATPFVVPLLRPLASPLCGGLVGSFHEVRFEHRRPCPQPA